MTKTIPMLSRNNAVTAGHDQSLIVPAVHLRLGHIVVLLITVCLATALQAAPLSQDEINDLVKRLETV
jgi:hypothetical protein